MLLLRNVPLDGEKVVYSIVFENEKPDDVGTDEEARGMKERNKIRDILREAFKTIRVVCMPPPHADIGGTYSSSLNMALHWAGLRHVLGWVNMCGNAPPRLLGLDHPSVQIAKRGDVAWRTKVPGSTWTGFKRGHAFDSNATNRNQQRVRPAVCARVTTHSA